MMTLLAVVFWLLFPMICFVGCLVLLALAFPGERLQPEPKLPSPPPTRSRYAPYAPPAVVRLEPKAPGYLRRWTVARKWHEQQDKDQWMSEFSRLQTAPPGRGSTGGSTAAPVSGG